MRFKKTLLIGVGSILMFTMGGVGPASADNGPHRSSAALASSTGNAVGDLTTTGRCASCHRAHTAKAEYLLKQSQPQLCYSCHDGTVATTNVVDGNDGARGLRGGGFRNAQIVSDKATKDMGLYDAATGRTATLNQTIPVGGVIPVGGTVATFPLVIGTGTGTTGNVTSKHQIDGNTAGTAWGNGSDASGVGKSITLECGSCHDPHGNKNYRILRAVPTDSAMVLQQIKAAIPAVTTWTDAGGVIHTLPYTDTTGTVHNAVLAVPAVMLTAAGVNIPDAGAKVYSTANYWLSGDTNVPIDATAALTGAPKATDGLADGYVNNIANWCTTCHTRYLADTGSYKTALAGTGTLTEVGQTPKVNVDVNYTYRHRSNANYKAGAANCITCHVSHGSNASVSSTAVAGGLNPGDTLAAAGDSRLLRVDNRGTCSMCHNV